LSGRRVKVADSDGAPQPGFPGPRTVSRGTNEAWLRLWRCVRVPAPTLRLRRTILRVI
jgi:hypothetical protein